MKNYPKIHLCLATLFLVLSTCSFVFLYRGIERNKTETANIKNTYEVEERRRAEIRSLESTVKNIEKEKIALDSHFARKENPVEFLNSLQSGAIQAGAIAEYSTLDSLKEGGGILVLMKVDGSFEAIYKYITMLENSPYELEIQSLDISHLDKIWQAGIRVRLVSFSQ